MQIVAFHSLMVVVMMMMVVVVMMVVVMITIITIIIMMMVMMMVVVVVVVVIHLYRLKGIVLDVKDDEAVAQALACLFLAHYLHAAKEH